MELHAEKDNPIPRRRQAVKAQNPELFLDRIDHPKDLPWLIVPVRSAMDKDGKGVENWDFLMVSAMDLYHDSCRYRESYQLHFWAVQHFGVRSSFVPPSS
ncbi:hypothetical protein E1B28_002056 [Marasmius oreades]|uniref:Uncharacterized protein n=1 Tax=Marasmius oreades TaxID=181124 RepID=A0A9P7V4S3_9AGAR|nr:uncharacterized protein E1B28_002056 [Marasmius oreades]KAG7100283.1 hypothetical protein E1B28_002056 [Marasmius oreades]